MNREGMSQTQLIEIIEELERQLADSSERNCGRPLMSNRCVPAPVEQEPVDEHLDLEFTKNMSLRDLDAEYQERRQEIVDRFATRAAVEHRRLRESDRHTLVVVPVKDLTCRQKELIKAAACEDYEEFDRKRTELFPEFEKSQLISLDSELGETADYVDVELVKTTSCFCRYVRLNRLGKAVLEQLVVAPVTVGLGLPEQDWISQN